MKAAWQTKKLVDFSQTISTGPFGSLLHKSDYVKHGIPVVNPSNIIESRILPDPSMLVAETTRHRLNSYILQENDIVVARRGEIGRCAVVGRIEAGWLCGTGSFFIRPSPCVSSQFLAHLIRSSPYSEQLDAAATGTTMKNLSNTALGNLVVSIPPLREQQRILGILDKAFDSIATAKANAEKNLQNARALFENYLQSVFNEPGEAWLVKKVSEIAKHSLGKMLDKNKNKGDLQRYLRNVNVRWFAFDLSDLLEMRFLPGEAAKYTVTKGDVLVCEGGYPGRAAIWTEEYPIYFQKALHRIRFQNPQHNQWFVYFLYSLDKRGTLRQHFTGTGIQHFTGEVLSRFQIPLAPEPELRKLISRFDKLFAEVKRLESIYNKKLAALDALKKSLLHQAFTGEL